MKNLIYKKQQLFGASNLPEAWKFYTSMLVALVTFSTSAPSIPIPQVGSGVHTLITDKEVEDGNYYWGRSAIKDSLLNQWGAIALLLYNTTLLLLYYCTILV